MRLRLVAAIGIAAVLVGAALSGASTGPFVTVRVPGSSGFAEPRESVTPTGQIWLESNAANGSAAVWGSKDGKTWTPTPTQPADQNLASTDVDVVTLPTGRIVETELDFGGINFRTDYSDDGGATWIPSQGTTLADTDRPWLAA